MPHISLDNHKVSVSLSDSKSTDIDRQTKWFFKAVGAKFNESSNSFIFEKPPSMTTLYKVLIDAKNFFAAKGWNVTFDSDSENLLFRVTKDSLDLDNAKKIGMNIKNAEQIESVLPASFKRTLFDYQKKSVKHLTEIGNAANFSVPGSGKTTISYAVYSILKNKGVVDKILVMSPRAAFVPWEEEFVGCFGYRPNVVRLNGGTVDYTIDSDTRNKE